MPSSESFDQNTLANESLHKFGIGGWSTSLREHALAIRSESEESYKKILQEYLSTTNIAILALARNFEEFDHLRFAIRPYFSEWEEDYFQLLKVFIDNGYEFRTINTFSEDDASQRYVFLRYDVHVRDLPGLYGYLDVNAALGIPSDAYLFWRHGKFERSHDDDFKVAARHAQGANCRIGFHCSPVDSHLIQSEFGGSERRYVKWVNSHEGHAYLERLAQGGRPLANLVRRSERHFRAQARSFRRNFPAADTITQHGGSLGYVLRKTFGVVAWPPEAADLTTTAMGRLYAAISAEGFVDVKRTSAVGFTHNADIPRNSGALAYITDGVRDEDEYLDQCFAVIESGSAVQMLFHPATLAGWYGHGRLGAKLSARLRRRR